MQLQAISDYGANIGAQAEDATAVAISKLSKMVLINPATKSIVGVVLCFDSDRLNRWDGLLVRMMHIHAYIYSCIYIYIYIYIYTSVDELMHT